MSSDTYCIPYQIQIRDINYGHHVGADSLINILHQARLSYLKSLGDFSEISIDKTIGLIMLDINIQFKQQLMYEDKIHISICVLEIKRTNFVLQYQIYKQEALTHICTTKMGFFDYSTQSISKIPPLFEQILLEQKNLIQL